jgi:hypothetical protein
MIGDITRKALNMLAAFALLARCLVQPQALAREEAPFVWNTISWGMVRGQMVRFSVFSPNEPSERERPMVFIRVILFDASGALIANSDEIAIPPGEFRSVDFNRDDLPVAADQVGGRLQTRAQVRYRFFSIVDRTQFNVLPTSIELIDVGTGQTTQLVSHVPQESGFVSTKLPVIAPPQAPTEIPVIVYANRGLLGLVYWQKLRLSAHFPIDPGPQSQPVRALRARMSLYGANGALLAQSDEATIAPGAFHSFDFDRADIPASGEPVGGRLQMRVSLEVAATNASSFTQNPKAAGPIATSLELIDNSTGRTTAVWLTVGFFEVPPSRNPE